MLDEKDKQQLQQAARIAAIKFPLGGQDHEKNLMDLRFFLGTEIGKLCRAYEKRNSYAMKYELRRAGLFSTHKVNNKYYEKFKAYEKEITDFINKEIKTVLQGVNERHGSVADSYWGLGTQLNWAPITEMPLSPDGEMSPREAEEFVTQAMLFFGATGAKTTRFTQDGGADCISDEFVVQVKHKSSKVGVADIREVSTVGQLASKQAIVFSKSGFTSGAIELSILQDVLLFAYLPIFTPQNLQSRRALEEGLVGRLYHEHDVAKRNEIKEILLSRR